MRYLIIILYKDPETFKKKRCKNKGESVTIIKKKIRCGNIISNPFLDFGFWSLILRGKKSASLRKFFYKKESFFYLLISMFGNDIKIIREKIHVLSNIWLMPRKELNNIIFYIISLLILLANLLLI